MTDDRHFLPSRLLGRRTCVQIRRYLLVAIVFLTVLADQKETRAEFQPLVAVVMCQDTYNYSAPDFEGWLPSQASSQALVGLVGLVGVPYHTLTLRELLETTESAYTSVWFSYCVYIHPTLRLPLQSFLQSHLAAGGSVVLNGSLDSFYIDDQTGERQYRSMADEMPFLALENRGYRNFTGHEIYTTASSHPIAKRTGIVGSAQLTQGMRGGLEFFTPMGTNSRGSEVLLELVDPSGGPSSPFLVVTEPVVGGRVVAVGEYGSYAGAASPIRNDPAATFYDNLLIPYLIESVLWAIGPDNEPFAGLQLSHAPVTAIGRLDGDWSGHEDATDLTFDYLIELAKRTGVASVYGIVSSFAAGSVPPGSPENWASFSRGGQELQRLGGNVGTHSHTHYFHMSDELDDAGWQSEVAGSLAAIRDRFQNSPFDPAANSFINPGAAIRNHDYGRFFAIIDLFMTHGFELYTPYATGVMGFGLPEGVEPIPVIHNSPMPDFMWMYIADWNYTIEQATTNQALVLDFFQDTIGRGVLYNQMWHDYAISGLDAPANYPDTPSLLPLFDANGDHFTTSRIYAPSIDELVDKMHVAHKVALSSRMNGNDLVVTLDYSALPTSRVDSVVGMGVRVNHSDQPISAVTVDGAPHYGFTSDTVLLPPAEQSSQTVVVSFADQPGPAVRLTYISKPYEEIESEESGAMHVWLQNPSLATRFCLEAPRATVVLHADSYQRSSGDEFCGEIAYESDTTVLTAQPFDTGTPELYVQATERAITSALVEDDFITLQFGAGAAGRVYFAATEAPDRVLLDGQRTEFQFSRGEFSLKVPKSTDSVPIVLQYESGKSESSGCSAASNPQNGNLHAFLLLALIAIPMLRRRRTINI
ncbi:MAG: hypothetical protein MJE77_24335 [Proteobacteria bacterium]|nr:hypothetical protein [Pseudomonadota bacterium]